MFWLYVVKLHVLFWKMAIQVLFTSMLSNIACHFVQSFYVKWYYFYPKYLLLLKKMLCNYLCLLEILVTVFLYFHQLFYYNYCEQYYGFCVAKLLQIKQSHADWDASGRRIGILICTQSVWNISWLIPCYQTLYDSALLNC